MINFEEINNMEDLVSLISSYKNLNEFMNAVKITRKKANYSELNLNYYIDDINNQVGKGFKRNIQNIVYKNWSITRHFVRIYHKIKRINNPNYYYQNFQKIFVNWEKNGLQEKIFSPIISDTSKESKDPIFNYFNNLEKLKIAHELLHDITSKNVLIGIIKTRLSLNLSFINKIGSNPINEYSEEFINIKEELSTFVDAGAFDGDSFIKIIDAHKNLDKGILFEPNSLNSRKIPKNLIHYNGKYKLYEYGLSNATKSIEITIDGVSSSIFKTKSDLSEKALIKLIKLDDLIVEKIALIKMDIEGSELYALKGSIKIIKKYQPVLAINIDHRISDIWQIIIYLHELDLNYNFHMKHYIHAKTGLYGSILYAVK